MSEQLRTAWDATAMHNRISATLGAGVGRQREDLAHARYYGPTRIDYSRRPGTISSTDLLRCFQHGDSGETRCINCNKPLCADCGYLLTFSYLDPVSRLHSARNELNYRYDCDSLKWRYAAFQGSQGSFSLR